MYSSFWCYFSINGECFLLSIKFLQTWKVYKILLFILHRLQYCYIWSWCTKDLKKEKKKYLIISFNNYFKQTNIRKSIQICYIESRSTNNWFLSSHQGKANELLNSNRSFIPSTSVNSSGHCKALFEILRKMYNGIGINEDQKKRNLRK